MKKLTDLENSQKGFEILSDCIYNFQLWIKETCAKSNAECRYILPFPEANIQSFQHLCFRIKNAVFSLTITLYDSLQKGPEGYETMDLQPQDAALNAEMSAKYNLIAGRILLDIQN